MKKLIVLCFLCVFSVCFAKSNYVLVTFVAPTETPTLTYILQESFEGTGYENTWTEPVGDPDEDSTGPGTLPTGGDSQCLYVTTSGVREIAAYQHATEPTEFYARGYYYIDSWSTSLSQDSVIMFIASVANPSTTAQCCAGINIYNNAGTYIYRLGYYESGWQFVNGPEITLDTWERVELYVNTVSGNLDWRINGASQTGVSGASLQSVTNYINVGATNNNPTTNMYVDLVEVATDGWIGE